MNTVALITMGAFAAFLLSPAAVQAGIRPMTDGEIARLAKQTVQRFFPAVDPLMLRAIAQIESNGNPRAFRNEPHIGDASVGLMQTLLGTAQWVWDTGFHGMGARPTNYEVFLNAKVSMYYGAGYVHMLRTWGGRTRSEEWIVRAYNGGPGNAESAATDQYWSRYQVAKLRLEG